MRVARRYAKGLLAVAQEDNKVREYGEEMSEMIKLLDQNPELTNVLANPLYDRASRRKVLDKVLAVVKPTAVMTAFLKLSLEKERLRYLKAIAVAYQKLLDEYLNIGRAIVFSATPLEAAAQEKLRAALAKATGKQIVLSVEHDPALIGGLRAKIGDLVLDGSIRTQLEALKNSLKRGELL
jgi:F-type H+-transporting ATPase subunit delta